MFPFVELEKYDDYFAPMSKRQKKGVFFYRFIGYDHETMAFYRRVQLRAETTGKYIRESIQNPDDSQAKHCLEAIGNREVFQIETVEDVVSLLFDKPFGAHLKTFSHAVFQMLAELHGQSVNAAIIKNAFVKFMCWGCFVFQNAIAHLGDDLPPVILYEGDISKYEVYMLHILSMAGCDVLYLNFLSDESYLKTDSKSAYSMVTHCKTFQVPKKHFSVEESSLVTNQWLKGSFLDAVFQNNSARRGLDTLKFYNIFGCLFGINEKDEYESYLFKWRQKLKETDKQVIFVESKIANPTNDEVALIKSFPYSTKTQLISNLAANIKQTKDASFNRLIQQAFVKILENHHETVLSKLNNYGVKLLCWLNRYGDLLFDKRDSDTVPLFLFYGNCTKTECDFLYLLSHTPVDVILISPDKSANDQFHPYEEEFERVCEYFANSHTVFPFPKEAPKVRVATVAYSAKRELDNILYTDTGLFRDKQFVRSNPVTLKTTYDEIHILWKEEAKYRPGFEVKGDEVTVPNIFAKICGVNTEKANEYFGAIENLLTEKTILITKIPYLTETQSSNQIKPYTYKFIEDGVIKPEAIRSHKVYQYDYLSDSVQDFILHKIQQLIDLKWVKSQAQGIEHVILSTLLNMDKNTLMLIQQYDFTKEIPKVVVIDVDESMLSIEDCIYIAFLNLVGFDILVFTPTGFRNIDKYIAKNAYEEYQIGSYLFHLSIPAFRTSKQTRSSIINRFFR